MTNRRIGVLGGTFDPIHLGHLVIAAEIRFALALDQIVFVPAGRPPHKPDQRISDDRHRLAMVELAVAGRPEFAVSTVDLDRGGPSFTADTLAILSAALDPVDLYFLMGADSLNDLATWHEPDRIASRALLAVATRPGVVVDLEAVHAAVPATRGRVRLVDVPQIGVSASDLRRRVAESRPIAFLVPEAVERYIHAHRLYRLLDGAEAPKSRAART